MNINHNKFLNIRISDEEEMRLNLFLNKNNYKLATVVKSLLFREIEKNEDDLKLLLPSEYKELTKDIGRTRKFNSVLKFISCELDQLINK